MSSRRKKRLLSQKSGEELANIERESERKSERKALKARKARKARLKAQQSQRTSASSEPVSARMVNTKLGELTVTSRTPKYIVAFVKKVKGGDGLTLAQTQTALKYFNKKVRSKSNSRNLKCSQEGKTIDFTVETGVGGRCFIKVAGKTKPRRVYLTKK
jgi:hypothetical protein